MIQIFSNSLGKEELGAVERVFESRWIGRGKECEGFEREFADYNGVDSCYLVNGCTSGLYLALRALGIRQGSQVIIPSIHFIGALNAILEVGATPVFADVDKETLQITPEEIKRLCDTVVFERPKTDPNVFLMLLNYGGNLCPDEVFEIAEKRCLIIIEDCANVGLPYKPRGDAAVWSFDAMKMLVMGDGGAVWSRGVEIRKRLSVLRYLGMKEGQQAGAQSKAESRWWEYEVKEASLRWISNDVLGAIGREQLKKLPGFLERRLEILKMYRDSLPNIIGSYYLCGIQTDKRDELAAHLRKNGVYTTFRYYPLDQVMSLGRQYMCENAHWIAEHTLNLPIHQNLTDRDVLRIIALTKEVI